MAISKIPGAGVSADTLEAGDLAPNSVDSSELVDGSVDLSHMSANSVDSDQYVDGSIDTAHIDDDQVTGAKIENNPTIAGNLTVAGDIVPSTPLSNRNMIINGEMQVWQRNEGTASPYSVAVGSALSNFGYHTADRWYMAGFGNADNYNATLSQGTVDGNALLEGHKSSFKVTTTEPEVAIAADEQYYLTQIIEAQNLQHLAYGTASAKTTTVSFWVKSSITGVFAFSVMKADSATRDIGSTYTINSANTFEQKTITIVGDTHATGTIDNNVGQGLYLRWYLAVGADMTGTANTTWANEDNARAANLHAGNAVITTDNATWEITGVQFELGSNATPFEHRSYGDELARCQRYYTRMDDAGGALGAGYFNQSSDMVMYFDLPTTMRDSPTLIQTGAGSGSGGIDGSHYWRLYNHGGYNNTDGPFSLNEGKKNRMYLYQSNAVSGTAGSGCGVVQIGALLIAAESELT